MKNLNNRFDTSKPFLESMVLETNETWLPDSVFEQACEEFGISEEDAMNLMVSTKQYDFFRNELECGWNIIIK